MALLAIVAVVKESFAPAREQTVSFYWCTSLYRRKRHDVCDEDARDIDTFNTRSDSQWFVIIIKTRTYYYESR